jgi:hypothetical protein
MEEKKSHFLTRPLKTYLLMDKKKASFQMAQLSEYSGMTLNLFSSVFMVQFSDAKFQ